MNRQALLKISLLVLLALLMQACGFQLRGMGGTEPVVLPDGIGPVYIQGLTRGTLLYQELEALLIDNGAGVAAAADQAASRLRIGKRVSDRWVLAVDSNGKVIEYELLESIGFSLVDSNGATLVPEQSVTLMQSYINPGQEVLGRQQEEQQLREDMRRRLANQIMRRLAAQLR